MPYKGSEKERAYQRAWKAAHREEVAAYRRAYTRTDRYRQWRQRYSDEHREALREAQRQYRADYPEKHALYEQRYTLRHPEKVRAKRQRQKLLHPETYKAARRRRRARLRGAALNDFTATQWQEMKVAYDHRCVYCGRTMQRLTMDHLTPLSKGGNHTASNIVPACHSCNSRKNAGDVLCPVQPLLLTVA